MCYSIYNIKDSNNNKYLLYITIKPKEFPWEIINKNYLLKFDFCWGLYNNEDKNILYNALSNDVKINSVYIISETPFLHFLHYINKSNLSYEYVWIFDEDIYEDNIINALLGSEFQIDKNISILNIRQDIIMITSYDNLFIIDDKYKYNIKESLRLLNTHCICYITIENTIKKIFEKFNEKYNYNNRNIIIKNNKCMETYLTNQHSIPKILHKKAFIIKFKYLIKFYNTFTDILIPFNNNIIKYLLGIYYKKIITICYSNIEKFCAIIACHNKCNNHFKNYTMKLINELTRFTENIIIVYSGIIINYINNPNIKLIHVNNKGYDCGKWYIGLTSIDYTQYDRIILINDSICFLRPLDDLFSFVQGRPSELIGLIDSNEIKYHVQSHFRFYTPSGINKAIYFFKKCNELNMSNNELRTYIINNFEININLWNFIESYYTIDDLNYHRNINYDIENLKKKIITENYPICKVLNYNLL